MWMGLVCITISCMADTHPFGDLSSLTHAEITAVFFGVMFSMTAPSWYSTGAADFAIQALLSLAGLLWCDMLAGQNSDYNAVKLANFLTLLVPVAFVPVTDEQTLEEMLPSQDLIDKAGLRFEVSREQPLNDKLSRWLVCYTSAE